jgi:hypothetical protein
MALKRLKEILPLSSLTNEKKLELSFKLLKNCTPSKAQMEIIRWAAALLFEEKKAEPEMVLKLICCWNDIKSCFQIEESETENDATFKQVLEIFAKFEYGNKTDGEAILEWMLLQQKILQRILKETSSAKRPFPLLAEQCANLFFYAMQNCSKIDFGKFNRYSKILNCLVIDLQESKKEMKGSKTKNSALIYQLFLQQKTIQLTEISLNFGAEGVCYALGNLKTIDKEITDSLMQLDNLILEDLKKIDKNILSLIKKLPDIPPEKFRELLIKGALLAIENKKQEAAIEYYNLTSYYLHFPQIEDLLQFLDPIIQLLGNNEKKLKKEEIQNIYLTFENFLSDMALESQIELSKKFLVIPQLKSFIIEWMIKNKMYHSSLLLNLFQENRGVEWGYLDQLIPPVKELIEQDFSLASSFNLLLIEILNQTLSSKKKSKNYALPSITFDYINSVFPKNESCFKHYNLETLLLIANFIIAFPLKNCEFPYDQLIFTILNFKKEEQSSFEQILLNASFG